MSTQTEAQEEEEEDEGKKEESTQMEEEGEESGKGKRRNGGGETNSSGSESSCKNSSKGSGRPDAGGVKSKNGNASDSGSGHSSKGEEKDSRGSRYSIDSSGSDVTYGNSFESSSSTGNSDEAKQISNGSGKKRKVLTKKRTDKEQSSRGSEKSTGNEPVESVDIQAGVGKTAAEMKGGKQTRGRRNNTRNQLIEKSYTKASPGPQTTKVRRYKGIITQNTKTTKTRSKEKHKNTNPVIGDLKNGSNHRKQKTTKAYDHDDYERQVSNGSMKMEEKNKEAVDLANSTGQRAKVKSKGVKGQKAKSLRVEEKGQGEGGRIYRVNSEEIFTGDYSLEGLKISEN